MILSISGPHSIINLTQGQNESQDNLNDNLVLYLSMNEGSQDIAYDLVGEANGSIFNADWYIDETYIALQFNGVSSFVTIPSPPQINANEFTISVFTYYYDMSTDEGWSSCIITQDDDSMNGGSPGFQLSHYNRRVWWGGANRGILSIREIEFDQWYHLVITLEGTNVKMWINGAFQDQSDGFVSVIDRTAIDIGRKNIEESYFYFKGLMDDIKIFDVALTEEQIIELYNQGHSIMTKTNVGSNSGEKISPNGLNQSVTTELDLNLKNYVLGLPVGILIFAATFLIIKNARERYKSI